MHRSRKRVISVTFSLIVLTACGAFVQRVLASPDVYSDVRQTLETEIEAPILLPTVEGTDLKILTIAQNRYVVGLINPGQECPDYAPCHVAILSVRSLSSAYPRRNEDKRIQLENGAVAQFFVASPPEVPASLVFEMNSYQFVLSMPNADESEIIAVTNEMLNDEN